MHMVPKVGDLGLGVCIPCSGKVSPAAMMHCVRTAIAYNSSLISQQSF
jgi:hypothetical protein